MHVNVPTLFVVLILIGIGGFLFNREHSQTSIKDTVTTLISPTPPIINNQIVNLNDKEFAYYLFRLKDPKKLSLYSNLKEERVFDYENTCEFASNGGFYDETSGHIGLFIEKGKVVSPFLHDALFNGVLYSDGTNVRLTTSDPGEDLLWAVQSGPIRHLRS
jgi:uncharacterized protein YigE (DUF2233 family)